MEASTLAVPSLTREEAADRARILTVDRYGIVLDLTNGKGAPAERDSFRSITTVKFGAQPDSSTFIDIIADKINSATLNDQKIDIKDSTKSGRIELSGLKDHNHLVVDADCRYSNTGEGLHRFKDDEDNEIYLYTQFEPAEARRVFACFDQPDLKAEFDVTVTAPPQWEVISNSTAEVQDAGNAKVHTPWPLPDFSLHIDEHFGNDVDTPQVTVNVSLLLQKEIEKSANWSAQLPAGGDGLVSLAKVDAGTDVLAHPLGTLTFQQKLVPFDLHMDKASGSKIDGANEFSDGALVLTQDGAPTSVGTAGAQTTSDFFAAAQFIEMSQADKLAKPSFESYTAGYRLASEDFAMDKILATDLRYEEADLGEPPQPKLLRRKASDAYLELAHGTTMSFGAAGRSPRRDRALSQPAQSVPIKISPAPMAVADKSTLAITAGGRTFGSVWRAVQARDAVTTAATNSLHVVELAELPA